MLTLVVMTIITTATATMIINTKVLDTGMHFLSPLYSLT